MTKKKFLDELRSRLSVLSEEEIEDITLEYKNSIEEKVKKGKTVSEAIEDFGDIDVLTDAILEAYKINPNNAKGKETNIVEEAEKLIKKGAKKLSDVANNIADDMKKNNRKLTTEDIFEMVIKVLILLVLLAILRLPFHMIESLLESILSVNISGIDWIFTILVKLVVWVSYLAVCAIIFVTFFKKFFDKTGTIESVKEGIKKEVKKDYPEEYEEYEKKQAPVEPKKSRSTLAEVLIMILKIFLFLSFSLPLICTNIGFWCALAVLIYLLIKGLHVIGFIILVVGLIFIFGVLTSVINNLIFNFKKTRFSLPPFIIGVILVIVGGLISVESALKYEYITKLPENFYDMKTEVVEERIDRLTTIEVDGKKDIIIDNELEDNMIQIIIGYYKFVEPKVNKDYDYTNEIEVEYYQTRYNHEMLEIIIENLKEYKIYNLSELYDITVEIRVNENTRNLVR